MFRSARSIHERNPEALSIKELCVLIPTYNRFDALKECLTHLENQTFKNFEVLVVDDGSTDAAQSQMDDHIAKTALTIRYVKQQNGGPAKARNLGLSLIQAPICLMLGDDIFALPNLVEFHIRLHRHNPNLEVAGLGLTEWSSSKQNITPYMRWLGKSPIQFAYRDLLAGVRPDWRHFYTSNLSVKTELLKSFPFNESFPYAAIEDTELGYRIQKQFGLKLNFIPEARADHLHPTTFLQSCERMIRVGYSSRLFHDLWPERRPPPSNLLKRIFKNFLISRPSLLKMLRDFTSFCSQTICPGPLIKLILACYFAIGYGSRGDKDGKLES
jgi:glycosyltransferase involved in cell wall biosynthesis